MRLPKPYIIMIAEGIDVTGGILCPNRCLCPVSQDGSWAMGVIDSKYFGKIDSFEPSTWIYQRQHLQLQSLTIMI